MIYGVLQEVLTSENPVVKHNLYLAGEAYHDYNA